jgi:nitric oxide reductase NorD protein
MAVPGIRTVADARQRLMANPESQAAWAVLDSGFAAAADVFDECYVASKRVIAILQASTGVTPWPISVAA